VAARQLLMLCGTRVGEEKSEGVWPGGTWRGGRGGGSVSRSYKGGVGDPVASMTQA
jgi:hypothetical protein